MKNPAIKDDDLLKAYEIYNNKDIATGNFKLFCIKLISESRVPNERILRELKTSHLSRDQVLFKISNFAMKGHGYGVL
jgi:hypothetical protein